MKKIVGLLFALSSVSLLFLSACAPTEEEALNLVEEAAKATFEADTIEPNQEVEGFSVYLPDDFEIVEETESNLLLESGDQMFILFYNALEASTSQLNYQTAEANDNYSLLQSFEDNERFGYVKVAETEEIYELQVGVGGVKITTQTTLETMEDDTIAMMQMATSIAYTDQN
ncbi:hypothetical protein GCM10011351_09980 [Paraliobacillus quinghaiensis]|uniref:DUF4367 domain-containing protein n=1 Tax=Paraliobacillus quinghaiensis TaxID=470815 RepID=A0A917TKY5_9BACI|nr:hypothetical protein [Paraliobacillus quinghaiensis]GGM26336.1 hypothetical protein GCM10011351_09980 [Paraliobacillus quinghaiensis]